LHEEGGIACNLFFCVISDSMTGLRHGDFFLMLLITAFRMM